MTQIMAIDGMEYVMGTDLATGNSIEVEDCYIGPDADHPKGSWMHKVGDEVTVATGRYATLYPGKPSPLWHGGPPFVVIDTTDWSWQASKPAAEKEKL